MQSQDKDNSLDNNNQDHENADFLDNLESEIKSNYIDLKTQLEDAEAKLISYTPDGISSEDAGQIEKCKRILESLEAALRRESNLKIEIQILSSKMSTNNIRIQQLQKINTSDNENNDFLKREVDAIQEELEDACERERHQKDVAEKLRIEILHLSKCLEDSNIKELESEKQLQDVCDQRDKITSEKERVQSELSKSQREIAELLQVQLNLENQQTQCESQINDYQLELQKLQNESETERIKRQKLEKDISEIKDMSRTKEDEIAAARQKSDELKLEIKKINEIYSEKEHEYKTLATALKNTLNNCEKLKADIEEQKKVIYQYEEEKRLKHAEINLKTREASKIKNDLEKITSEHEHLKAQFDSVKSSKVTLEGEKSELEQCVDELGQKLDKSEKILEDEKKKYSDAIRERNIVNKNYLKASVNTEKQDQLLKLHENSKKTLEVEIQNFREETQSQRKMIGQLEHEKEKYISEATELSTRIANYLELIKDKDSELDGLKRQIGSLESKLKQQKSLFESARSDRNACSKNLAETQDVIVDSRKQLRILNHQVEQLKEEITNSEITLAKERTDRQKAERERESLRNEVNRVVEKIKNTNDHLEVEKTTKIQLEANLNEIEHKMSECSKEMAKVASTRDLLGSQLVKKSKEVELLCEKVNIQNVILARGEQKYTY